MKIIYIEKKMEYIDAIYFEAVVAQWHKRVTVNAMVLGSIPTRRTELLFIKTFISSL